MKQKRKKSSVAVVITVLYLIAVAASLVSMVATVADTGRPTIFLIMVTMPWSLLFIWLQEILHFHSVIILTVFMVAGGVLNSVILYMMTSFVTGGYKN